MQVQARFIQAITSNLQNSGESPGFHRKSPEWNISTMNHLGDEFHYYKVLDKLNKQFQGEI
jgi:hypothetical protein